jgi:hypothetical protein
MKILTITLALLLVDQTAASAVIVVRSDTAVQSLQAVAETPCVSYHFVRSTQRDALRFDRFLDAAPGRQAVRTDPPGYAVAASFGPSAWILSRWVTPDSFTFMLRRPNPTLVRKLATFGLETPNVAPVTMRGIRLGDPISKVTNIFRVSHPHAACGFTLYSYAWPLTINYDDYVIYGVDRAGRIQYIEAGEGCCGKGHLWDQP